MRYRFYSYWQHTNGDVYAVKISPEGAIVGIYGPISEDVNPLPMENLPLYDYSAKDITWAIAETGRFTAL